MTPSDVVIRFRDGIRTVLSEYIHTYRQLQPSRSIDCAPSTCPRGPKISAFENLKNLDIKTPKLGLFNTRVRKIPSTRVTRTHPDCDSHWIYPGCNTTAAQPLNCFNVYNIPLAEQNNYNRPGGKKLLELAHIYYRDSNIVDPTGCARRPIAACILY